MACVLVTHSDGTVQRTIRTFSTMTADLLALDDWLRSQEGAVVAMESTGVYWHPVFNLLEEGRPIPAHDIGYVCGQSPLAEKA